MRGMSIGGGAADGFSQGIGAGIAMRDQGLREQDAQLKKKKFESDEQARQFDQERLTQNDTQNQQLKALAAIDQERADALGQIEADARQYGGADQIPQEVRQQHQKRVAGIVGRRASTLHSIYKPVVEKETQKARDLLSGLQSGAVDVNEISGTDLVQALTLATRRSPADFMRGDDGAPSKVEQGLQQFQQGMETKNQGMVTSGANALLAPELMMGVGDPAHDGNVISSKEIARFVPDQKDPSKFHPVLKVNTQRADGAKGSYLAPVTVGRTSHSDDTVAPPIDMQKAFDYAGRMGALAQIMNSPEIRDKVRAELQQNGQQVDSLLKAVYAAGGNMQTLTGKLTQKDIKLGDRDVLVTTDESGKTVNEREYKRGVSPDALVRQEGAEKVAGIRAAAGAGNRTSRDLEVIQDYAEENELTEEEAAAKLQNMGVIRGPKGPAANKPPSEAAIKGSLDGAMKSLVSQLGLKEGDKKGRYVNQKGQPATADQQAQLDAARAAMDNKIRTDGRAAPADLIQEGAKAAADHHDQNATQFAKDKVYVNAKGQQAKYGGKDANGKDIWLKP